MEPTRYGFFTVSTTVCPAPAQPLFPTAQPLGQAHQDFVGMDALGHHLGDGFALPVQRIGQIFQPAAVAGGGKTHLAAALQLLVQRHPTGDALVLQDIDERGNVTARDASGLGGVAVVFALVVVGQEYVHPRVQASGFAVGCKTGKPHIGNVTIGRPQDDRAHSGGLCYSRCKGVLVLGDV